MQLTKDSRRYPTAICYQINYPEGELDTPKLEIEGCDAPQSVEFTIIDKQDGREYISGISISYSDWRDLVDYIEARFEHLKNDNGK